MTGPSDLSSEPVAVAPSSATPERGAGSAGPLRIGSIVSAACATLIVLAELLVTDAGITLGLRTIVGGGEILTWIVFAVGAVGCCYLSFRFMDSALTVERELARNGF